MCGPGCPGSTEYGPGKEGGTPVKTVEIPLFLRDDSDYELGDAKWQDVQIHNICVKLQTGEPLSKADMSFLKEQNEHLRNLKKERKP